LPRHTDIRIEQLCTEAKAAKTERDAKGVIEELRSTLAEHMDLARKSLEAQASTLTLLEAKARNPKPRKQRPD